MNSNRISFYLSCLNYLLKSVVLRKELPFIGGIVVNDKCNLHCQHCSVSNRSIPDLSYSEINNGLLRLYNKGMRYLYIEGGEPFLWRDHTKNLEDIIQLARGIGFKFIVLYTNGTFPIETKADTVFVSLDGLKNIHDTIRGKSYDRIISNINSSSHKRIIANYTITRTNKNGIECFCEKISKIKQIKGIFFYFYTPHKGNNNLFLSPTEKKYIIEKILILKRKGYRILNSKKALCCVDNSAWMRPNGLSYLFAENKLFKCCRAFGNDEICKNCGYLSFAEIYQITRLSPDAILTAIKYL